MIWQSSPYFIPCVTCGLILVILGITGLRNRSCVCARSFSLLMFAGAVWAFCTALELSSADLQTQMLAILLEYPAMALIPVGWLLFAFEYTGRDDWISKKTVALLCIIPAITILMVATNEIHHLFYSTVTESVINGLSFHLVTYGPAFWIHALYSYSLIALTILLILQRFIFSSPVYRGQVVTILIATLFPLFISFVLVMRVGLFALIDPTPFALMVSGFILLIGMSRFQLLDLSPIAHEQILENMSDGVIVVDMQGRIISLNTPAGRFLDRPVKTVIGISITDVIPSAAPGGSGGNGSPVPIEQIHEMEREVAGRKQYFELRYLPLHSRGNESKGRVIMVRDITNQKVAEIALNAARKKLGLLSSITRHDILNQVTALLLNIECAHEQNTDPDLKVWLEKQEAAVTTIQHQIEFARDYESLGVNPPKWINIRQSYYDLLPLMEKQGISFDIGKEEFEVFGDPLLERVSFKLMDNSIRYGGHVTAIRVRFGKTPEGLVISHEDNGTGIAYADKEKIFRRGGDGDNGLGLFLVSEVLGITGMSIRECGEPGKGVRFEVHIPPGQFRQTRYVFPELDR